jgi:hypothetical protein
MKKTILTPDSAQTEGTNITNPNPYEVTCKDGTKDVGNGIIIPCSGHGGVKGDTNANQPTGTITTNQPKSNTPAPFKNMDVLTPEDKFYEKLGIKYHDTHMFGVDSRLKGRLLLIAIGVTGYLIWKKYKK